MTPSRWEERLPSGQALADVDLEPEFWDLLDQVGILQGKPINIMVQEIDEMRGAHSWANAIRVFLLKYFQSLPTGLVGVESQERSIRQTSIIY